MQTKSRFCKFYAYKSKTTHILILYAKRNKPPMFSVFLDFMENISKIEKNVANRNRNTKKYELKWNNFNSTIMN